MLRLKDIHVEFPGKTGAVHAVRAASLEVADGEVYGIVGTSGAGKSTLLRTVNLLQRPTSGEVWLDDVELTRLPERELRAVRRRIGMVFQHFNLAASRTVHDNIALPLLAAGVTEDKIRQRVPELLALVGLSDKEFVKPGKLSGGQKQRVGIARALATEPSVLLCDEPTSALDPESTESILQLLSEVNRRLGVTILVISHELAVIKSICHRVAVMTDGEIVEENGVFELFAHPVHDFTKELVNRSLELELPERVRQSAPGTLLRLVYRGESAEAPILSQAVRELGVHINILHGHIEYIDGRPLGVLIVGLEGSTAALTRTVVFLRERVARLEVLRHG